MVLSRFSSVLPLILASMVSAQAEISAPRSIPVPEREAHRTFGTASQVSLEPQSVKVLVWNIKKGEEPGLDRDLPAYGGDRDLLLIAEGLLSPAVQGIFDGFAGVRWDMAVSFLSGNQPAYATGTLIGSRVEPFQVKARQTLDREPGFRTPKALTIATYLVKGRAEKLLVISVHGINAVPTAAFERHMEMIRQEIAAHSGPVLLGGDFNTNLASKVRHLMALTASLGLEPVAFRNDERMKVLGQTIDYIFVRGMRVKDAQVLGQLTSSDHKAMLAEFEIR